MDNQTFNGRIWEIGDLPIEFSTPDDEFEYVYRATTMLEDGEKVYGRAIFRSYDGIDYFFYSIECEELDDDWDNEYEPEDEEDEEI